MTEPWKNQLYFGDNLTILREHIPDTSVNLVYLDPPFNSNATYNVLFAEQSGEQSAAQIAAFEDTWHWGMESEHVYQDVGRLLISFLASGEARAEGTRKESGFIVYPRGKDASWPVTSRQAASPKSLRLQQYRHQQAR